jgi:nucleotide-binding universal stress UspA family protein
MKFLVAIDGSEISQSALRRTLDLAVPTKADVVVLTIVEPAIAYTPIMLPTGDWLTAQGMPTVDMEQKLLEIGRSLLTKAEDACNQLQVSVQTRLEIGSAREQICKVAEAENADFLVVGSRGLGTMERLMLGSVSDYVVHHSPVPVIVVR